MGVFLYILDSELGPELCNFQLAFVVFLKKPSEAHIVDFFGIYHRRAQRVHKHLYWMERIGEIARGGKMLGAKAVGKVASGTLVEDIFRDLLTAQLRNAGSYHVARVLAALECLGKRIAKGKAHIEGTFR
jgi:hypothetical protein